MNPNLTNRTHRLNSKRLWLLAAIVLIEIIGAGMAWTLRSQAAQASTPADLPGKILAQTGPQITLSKLTNGSGGTPADGPNILVGDTVTWTYDVTNSGNADLTDVVITDDAGTPANTSDDVIVCTITSLPIGGSDQCTDTGTAVAGNYTNTATAVGVVSPTETVTGTDTSGYFGVNPVIILEKSTNDQDADTAPGPSLVVGSTVSWKYFVTNQGNATLTEITVTDSPAVTITCPKTTLNVSESMTCTASGTAQLGQFSNTATVSAKPPVGPNVTDTDPSHYMGIAGTNTPTITGTPPTPTATGTITPNPTITVSVAPTSARVNQTLTFIIRLTNPGTAPAINAILSDAFPTYIDVLSVTINQGTASKSIHSVTVNLGDLAPGDNVTVTISTKVNSSLTTSATVSNVASLTYNTNVVRTASVAYSVIATTTLPGTGMLPVVDRPTPVGTGVLVSVFLPVMMAGFGFYRRKGNQTVLLLVLLFSLAVFLVVACSGNETSTVEPVAPLDLDTETPTATLLPFMPAYRFATPEVYPEFPDYPVPSPTVVPEQDKAKEPDTSPVIRVVIPTLEVDALVKFVPFERLGWPVQGLREDVAWLGNTSWPGLGSNTVLAGHVTVEGVGNGPFRYLENLKDGDEVVVYTEEGKYTYAVRERLTVDETDLGVTLPTTEAQLTLITCTGWDTELSIYRFRRVVVADLVSNEPLVRQGLSR